VNKIKIKNLIAQLQVADQIEVRGEHESVRLVWDEADIKGDPENQVVLLTWLDDDETSEWNACEFLIILTEQGLSDARVSGNNIFCKDHEGNKIHLCLWERHGMDCEENLKMGANYP
jgi:hypothetical protein